jgi:hypothetical protein
MLYGKSWMSSFQSCVESLLLFQSNHFHWKRNSVLWDICIYLIRPDKSLYILYSSFVFMHFLKSGFHFHMHCLEESYLSYSKTPCLRNSFCMPSVFGPFILFYAFIFVLLLILSWFPISLYFRTYSWEIWWFVLDCNQIPWAADN